MYAHLAGLEQSRPGTERAGDVGRREAACLDVARVADPAQEAPCGAGLLARRVPGDIGEIEHPIQRRFVISGVVRESDRSRMREFADEIAPAQLHRVDPELPCRALDDALDEVRGLGA